jgi:hypothetical protein
MGKVCALDASLKWSAKKEFTLIDQAFAIPDCEWFERFANQQLFALLKLLGWSVNHPFHDTYIAYWLS